MKEENEVESVKKDHEKEYNDLEPYDATKDSSNGKPNKKNKKKIKSIIIDVILYSLIIYSCIYLIPTYVLQRTVVDGSSMENTLHDKEHLLVEKISYHFDKLKRFDIVVFYPYGRDINEYYVKRLIGLPGETVQIKGSDIYINGTVLDEDYGKDPIQYAGWVAEPVTLGDDEYFVLGDNRTKSYDSRYEDVGLISKENIGGRAILRIWPLNKFGFIK